MIRKFWNYLFSFIGNSEDEAETNPPANQPELTDLLNPEDIPIATNPNNMQAYKSKGGIFSVVVLDLSETEKAKLAKSNNGISPQEIQRLLNTPREPSPTK